MSEATSPLNIVLIFAITYLLYKILRPESGRSSFSLPTILSTKLDHCGLVALVF